MFLSINEFCLNGFLLEGLILQATAIEALIIILAIVVVCGIYLYFVKFTNNLTTYFFIPIWNSDVFTLQIK